MSGCIYELIDDVLNTLGAEKLGEYIFMNYPDKAQDIMETIHSLMMLELLTKEENNGSE